MKANSLRAMLLGCGLLCHLAFAQSGPTSFPLDGDWEGVLVFQGTDYHMVLHMNTTPEGKMTTLLDHTDHEKTSGMPAIGGSFDGSHLILRFNYWKPNSNRDLERKIASYDATVNPSRSEMSGVWTQEGSWPVNFKRLTWQAKISKTAPPTIFDGDWEGVEEEGRGLKLHFIFHIHNTEDGLMALLDCPEEEFKGALASKVSYDEESRQISITFLGGAIFAGKMAKDGKALDTSMTEPGYRFLIHFDRVVSKKTEPALATDTLKRVPVRGTATTKKIGVEELFRMVSAAHNMSDADLAKKLADVELTDRVSGARLADLMRGLPGDKSRLALMVIADQSIFLPPPADEIPNDAAPNAALAQQMLVKVVKYVNATVRQLPNLTAIRFSNGFEDQPREERPDRLGFESIFYLPLHWVGSVKIGVTYRDRQEMKDKSVKAEKKGNGVGGLITAGEFGPVLSIVLADALKSKLVWQRWEKVNDGTMAVFHYQVPEDKSNYHVKFCCISGYNSDGSPEMQVSDERSAYHGDIVFSPADGSIRLLTLEADVPAGDLVSSAGMAIEYAATDIGGRSYVCPVRTVSIVRTHNAELSGTGSNYKGPVKTFLNDVRFSNYRRFGSEAKVLTNLP